MGRLEKIVVLTVLFLVAVILGVSLNRGGERPGGAAGPASKGEQAALPTPAPTPTPLTRGNPTGASRGEGPAGALNTSVGSGPSVGGKPSEGGSPAGTGTPGEGSLTPTPDPVLSGPGGQEATPGTPPGEVVSGREQPQLAAPQGTTGDPGSATKGSSAAPGSPRPPAPAAVSWLVSEEGLQPSQDPAAMLYAWATGDSYAALAERFYGSRQQVARLHKANEGRSDAQLRPGELVFVPARAPAPDEVIDTTPAGAGQWYGGTYIVESGDILGAIAQRVYGSASRWRLIYEANRDVLASPDSLKVGMKLRIPAID